MKLIDMTVSEFIDKFNKLGDLRQEINEMIDRDTESFKEFMKAIKML